MAASSSSSSSRAFIHFEGVELRDNFIRQLEKAFTEGDIEYFIGIQRGWQLFKEIDDSKIALVVFSTEYSESVWRLKELVKIMERVEENQLKVIPIFYRLEVEDVFYSAGQFGDNLYSNGRRLRSDMPIWEKALKFVSSKKGLKSADYRTEGDFINDIVLAVKNLLAKISPLWKREEETNFSPRVFLNFRGDELGDNFISHLEKALREGGIQYFIDNKKGWQIFKEIDVSEIALVVFSKRYSESVWCLNELVKIMENVEEQNLKVIPIFFKVKVEDVKHFTGEFGKNFYSNFYGRHNLVISGVPKWEKALKALIFVSAKKGLDYEDYRSERDFIHDIVLEIKNLLAKREEETNMFSANIPTVSFSSNGSGTIEQPRMDPPLHVTEQQLKQMEGEEETNMFSCMASFSTSLASSTSMVKKPPPRVFVSSRGQLANNFISHLENALRKGGNECFIEKHLDPWDDHENLFKEIDDSKMALVIFSKLYLESVWCMEELVKIMERVEENKLEVIPIFYEHDGQSRTDVQKWQKALKFVSAKKGLVFEGYRSQGDFIDDIVLAVKNLLAKLSLEETYMCSTNIPTVSSSSSILSGTIDQPRMDPPLHVIEQRLKQLEEKWAEGPVVEPKVSPPQQHQVFISFRGEQLRNNFISHLVGALRSKMINVFIDKQENKGEDISNLLKRIEDSRIALVVFSSKYTESRWCLREAEKIKELAAQGKLKVLPIFYKVTPTNVKQLKGEFGDNFRDREREYRNDKSVIEKWKEAIKFIAGKLGFELDNQSDENDFIALSVREVLRMLTSIPLATQTAASQVNNLFDRRETY